MSIAARNAAGSDTMTTTFSTRTLGHTPFPAHIASDGIPTGGSFPRMSARAALLARSLVVAMLFSFLAATEPRVLVVLSFALPFWIAGEVEARLLRERTSSPLLRGHLLSLPEFPRRPSHPPYDHPKAA
jgi:hypothetical protein